MKTATQHRRRLIAVQSVTAAGAIAGGGLLAAAPDGHLLKADPSALTGSPFADWRIPGVLLAALVGGGYALSATATAKRWPRARPLAAVAGAGLIVFELAEVAWIGFQPLEAVFAGVGVYVLASVLNVRPESR